MNIDFAPTSTEDPMLMDMLKDYYDAFHLDRQTFKPPAQWVGAFDGKKLIAAIGFTRTPDSSVIFVAELVCTRNLRGAKALIRLVANFQTYCADHPDIQLVLAQCLETNTPMRKFLSRSTFMRPISTMYACSKSNLAEDSEHGRFRL